MERYKLSQAGHKGPQRPINNRALFWEYSVKEELKVTYLCDNVLGHVGVELTQCFLNTVLRRQEGKKKHSAKLQRQTKSNIRERT